MDILRAVLVVIIFIAVSFKERKYKLKDSSQPITHIVTIALMCIFK